MKFLLASVPLLFSSILFAQKEKNYILEINGDTVSMSVGEPASFKAKNGQTYKVNLKLKETLTYQDSMVFFQHPSSFTISTKEIQEGLSQVLCMSAGGNGFLVQEYSDVDPVEIVDLMLTELTQESKDAGYKETSTDVEQKLKSGRVLKGKQSKLVLDDETNIYAVYPVKWKTGGFLIVLLITDPTDTKEMTAFDKFWKTLVIQN